MENLGKKVAVKGHVCVTGASGYLASWLVKGLLSSGYHVIGTVRDPGNYRKVEHLWKLEGALERLQLVRADLMEDGSFDDAIMGCEGVFHTASPIVGANSDPKAGILDPAIDGTLNVLRSCKKNPFLKRVVITSSSSALRARDDFDPNTPLDESSWSNVDLCQRLKIWYALSKTLAERAAWEFAKENKMDLVTVLPSFVIGPSISPVLSPTASDVLALLRVRGMVVEDILSVVSSCSSVSFFWVGREGNRRAHVLTQKANEFNSGTRWLDEPPYILFKPLSANLAGISFRFLADSIAEGESGKFSRHGRMGYVDIDDVARCHILVYEEGSAEGRYLCSSRVLDIHELVSLLAERYPFLPISKRFENLGFASYYEFNTAKLSKLGFRFKGIEEMFDDCIASLKEQGHISSINCAQGI